MTNSIRASINTLLEAHSPVDKDKNVRVNIDTMARECQSKGKYPFNKGFMTFNDIITNPRPFVEKYRKESRQETTRLMEIITGLRENQKFTDKERYLRVGYEARGYSNAFITLVWFKDRQEDLIIFARNKQDFILVRDFLAHFRVIAVR